LWNPVLDLRHTFIEPSLPWGVENFGPTQQALLSSQGFLLLDGTFTVGRVSFEKMRLYDPRAFHSESGSRTGGAWRL
jgi:hypothetical protein